MIFHRSLLLAIVAAVALLGALPAQKEGKSILVDIFAPWCPTCRAQNPILVQLTREPQFNNLVVFKVDCDNQT